MTKLPGFGRFVSLTEQERPDLLHRVSSLGPNLESQRYGIVSRLVAKPNVSVAELGAAVLETLGQQCPMEMPALAAVVLSSRVDHVEEVARELVQRAGLRCPAVGIERACSGFPAATQLAVQLCQERGGPVALVTAEIISTAINWEPPQGTGEDHTRARGQAAKLFGDGAAAVLVLASGRSHPILDAWQDDVPDNDQLIQKTDVVDSLDAFGNVRPGVTACMTMPGRRGLLLVRRAPVIMADAVARSLRHAEAAGLLEGASVDHVVPHQANGLITAHSREELEKRFSTVFHVWSCIERTGNTVSASIPIAMANLQHELPPGALVAMPSVGAGWTGLPSGRTEHRVRADAHLDAYYLALTSHCCGRFATSAC